MSLQITNCRFCGRKICVEDGPHIDSCREFIKHVRSLKTMTPLKYCEQELEQIALKCDSETVLNQTLFPP